ncbi:Phosphatidylinositol-4-phosphate 5-kinase [Sorochytrium milnesiophthora]
MAIPPHTSAPSLTNRLSVVENPNQSDYIDAADANANPAAMATMGSGMAYSNPDSPVHHVRTRSMTRKVSDNFGIGTKIDKTHEKYQFMFHMLTGIRVSVSRCEAKEDRDRDLLPDDFTAQHKLTSDVTGAELESSERYDFKFKDYAPYAFRKIRVSFGISSAEYLNSLTGKYILSELFSPGKSKSFLYYSHDYRYIIKTIHRAEQKLLLKILPAYVDYVSKYPNTLLARYYGLHRVRVPGGPTVHFVVMSNVFPPTYDIHETYDLKGSTIGRETPAEDINHKGKRAVLKDLNWTKLGRKLKLGPEKKRLFVEQLEKDVRFLMDSKCMDYSLLIGVHYLNRGNGGASEEVLKVFEPNKETLHRSLSTRADAMRAAIRHPDLTVLSHQSKQELLPDVSTERSGCLFFADNGGFQSSDAFNQPSDELYFMSIIDMLTPYNATKRFEHLFKSITSDGNQISAVRPSLYGKRFIMFMKGLVGQ